MIIVINLKMIMITIIIIIIIIVISHNNNGLQGGLKLRLVATLHGSVVPKRRLRLRRRGLPVDNLSCVMSCVLLVCCLFVIHLFGLFVVLLCLDVFV